jgi:hypothetical protein
MKKILSFGFGILLALSVLSMNAFAQTTEFTYQGSLNTSGTPANGNHDFQFVLFDAATGGAQLSATLAFNNVSVANGIFTVNLNFPGLFPGADRFLEVRVRPSGAGSLVTLSPRSQIRSAPYSIKSTSSDTATNALQLGGVAANQYVLTLDPRMTDDRNPLAGSANYIQNQNAAPQASTNFSISGTGSANILNAGTQFNMAGGRLLSSPNQTNLFVGFFIGSSNTGTFNSFFGTSAGSTNTTGSSNSFYGHLSGLVNSQGGGNSFFGRQSGFSNSTGNDNAFFGFESGLSNNTGSLNSFYGRQSGTSNTTGSRNTLIGSGADVGANNLTFATAIGAGSIVATSNTVRLGRAADTVQVPGGLNVVGTVVLPNDAIASAEISDEPGLASSFEGVIGTVLSTSVQSLILSSINVPSSGYVLVLGGAQATATHVNGTQSSVTFGVSNFQTIFPSSQDVQISHPASAASGTYNSAVSVHHVFPVASAGMHNFFLLAQETSGQWTASEFELTLLFVPTQYGIVDRPENTPGIVSVQAAGVEPRLTSTNGTGESRGAQRKEIDALRGQVEALKKVVCAINPAADSCAQK